jgi:hypothetical protein
MFAIFSPYHSPAQTGDKRIASENCGVEGGIVGVRPRNTFLERF